MKATAIAPANIAFIKYWGRKDASQRLPYNASISMNLSDAFTTTTVDFSSDYNSDEIILIGGDFSLDEKSRIVAHIDRIRSHANSSLRAKIVTTNNFPKGTGVASSASGFAALTVAGFASLGLSISEKEMSIFARLGSGSACRSIPDGFVKWNASDDSSKSFAYSLHPSSYWDIRDILVIVQKETKIVSSSKGQDGVLTSPLFAKRLVDLPERIERIERALREKDFRLFGQATEEDCLEMHAVCHSQTPPIEYWTEETKNILTWVTRWRNEGLPVYFTIDAGPNVHILCEGKNESLVLERIKSLEGVQQVLVNAPSKGARIVQKHLF